MSSFRIVYVSYDRFPSGKGAATHIDAFVRALSAKFGRLDLITVAADSTKPPACSEYAPGIRHHSLPVRGATLIHRVFDFRRQLLGLLENLRPEIIHVRSIFEGFPIAEAKPRFCRQLVYEVNGLPSIELKYHYPDVADDKHLLNKLRHQEQQCLNAADLIVTISDVTARHLLDRGVEPSRLRVIPNGVDPTLFQYQSGRPWNGRTVRLFYGGTMAAWQGVLVAVEALGLLRRDVSAQLMLVGDARPRQLREIEKRCEKLGLTPHVEIRSAVSRKRLAHLQHQADVILAPLKANDRNLVQGCCPLKVLEAMASGTPLIASDLPVVRALARPGREATLVRPGSAKAIKDAVLRLRDDPHTARQMAAAARRRVKQHYCWSHAQEKLISAYEWLSGSNLPSSDRSHCSS